MTSGRIIEAGLKVKCRKGRRVSEKRNSALSLALGEGIKATVMDKKLVG